MSIDSARQLTVKLGTDAAFREQFERAAPAERTALLESGGFGDVTRADMEAAKTSETRELSDTDLQTVAGGDIGEWVDWARDWYNYFTS